MDAAKRGTRTTAQVHNGCDYRPNAILCGGPRFYRRVLSLLVHKLELCNEDPTK